MRAMFASSFSATSIPYVTFTMAAEKVLTNKSGRTRLHQTALVKTTHYRI